MTGSTPAQTPGTRHARGDTTSDTPGIQMVVRDYCKQLHADKLNKLVEMDTFLETYNLPRLKHKEIGNLNK